MPIAKWHFYNSPCLQSEQWDLLNFLLQKQPEIFYIEIKAPTAICEEKCWKMNISSKALGTFVCKLFIKIGFFFQALRLLHKWYVNEMS